MTNIQILKRLYKDYTKKYLPQILLSVFFSLLLAGSTSSIAYLLDPAINELFIKQSSSLILVIPFLIIVAFTVKGVSLYLAKVINEDYRKTSESLEVKFFTESDIPWNELAFPFVPTTLKKYFKDSIKGEYPLTTQIIERPTRKVN